MRCLVQTADVDRLAPSHNLSIFLHVVGTAAWNYGHELKNVFKSAATTASAMDGPFRAFYEMRVANGMLPARARLTLAHKMAAIALILWKKGETLEAQHLMPQAA